MERVHLISPELREVASRLYGSVSTEVSDSCRKKLEEGDLLGLVSMEIDPRDYEDPLVFRKDYQCVNFLRKLNVSMPGLDRRAVAVESFWKCEFSCKTVNSRFGRYLRNEFNSSEELSCIVHLERAREWLASVLGSLPDMIHGRFGPGATYEAKGVASTILDKLQNFNAITHDARDLLNLDSGYFHEARWLCLLRTRSTARDPMTVRGNRFVTVPKDAKKDRGICIEPGLNVWYQLGIAAHMRRRLKRLANIDLNSAQDVHRQWAQQASHDGLKATIDLSNASDTVAWGLVKWLMPPDWFLLLNSLRSPTTEMAGKVIKLEKFSSMGNGFTFELETLIFAALCHASGCGICGVDYRVFGDDIIVDSEHASSVLSVLAFCGFTPNKRKTFTSGWFRESCGGDYFKGVPVMSHHQECDPSMPSEWISLANGLRRVAFGRHGVGFCYTHLHAAWLAALSALPVEVRRLRGPSFLGDLVIHDHEWKVDEVRSLPGDTVPDAGNRNLYSRIRVWKPVFRPLSYAHWTPSVVMAYLTYSRSKDDDFLSLDDCSKPRSLPKWPFESSPSKQRGVVPRNSLTGEALASGYKFGYVYAG